MADISGDTVTSSQELRDHQRTFAGFGKLMLFAVLHIALVLAALALAFLGDAPLIALLLGLGGTVVLVAAFTIFD